MVEFEVIDATTKAGFLEIASAFGREKAHELRIAAYEARIEANMGFRWFSRRWEKARDYAIFERDYERANQGVCQIMREAGIGY